MADLQQRAPKFADKGYKIVAVRTSTRGAVDESTAGKFPALRFVVDQDDKIRELFRMKTGGMRGGEAPGDTL